MSGPAPSIQFSWDGPGQNGAGQDGLALLWNQAQGKFVMGAAGVTDHGALSGLSDDDHAGYALLAPAASTRNVIQPTGAAVIPMRVRGATSQSAALQTWENSSGTALLQITSGGQAYYGQGGNGGFVTFGASSLQLGAYGTIVGGFYYTAGVAFSVTNIGASNVGLVVKGSAAQASDLAQFWNSSSTVVASVGPTGQGLFRPSSDIAPLICRGHASQTANLQEWKDSAGTNKASLSPYGSLTCLSVAMSSTGGGLTFGSGSQWGSSAGSLWEINWNNYAFSSTAFIRFSSLSSPTKAAAVWIQNPSAIGNHVLRLQGMASQSGHLLLAEDSAAAVQFAIGAAGKVLTNQAVTNTNTPSGATAKAMPFYDAAGTLLGYAPLYAAPW